jgi:hypothetical protein
MASRQDTHGDAFVIQIDGQVIRDRGIAGELLLRHADRVRATQAGRLLGQFAAFQVFVAHNFMSGADIVLKGAGTYVAKAGTSALGTIRSVEYVIQNLDETAATTEQGIRETRERISDLHEQLTKAFEYEERLALLSQRQDEIEQALDLTKGQASAQLDSREIEESEETAMAMQPSQRADGISRGKSLEGVSV